MQALQEIAENTYINGRINNSKRGGYTVTKPGVFTFGSLEFKLNDIERKTSTPNPIDMERMKREIFAAREEHDYVVVCFHSHEIRAEKDEEPDYFIEEFSHACIDWGASAVIGTGTHQIKGIEIYKGFPIFYSIANFVFQGEMSPVLPADYYERYGVPKDKSAKDALAVRSNNGTRGLETESKNYRGLIPLLEFEDGKLTSVEVKPIELGFLKDEVNQKGLPFEANEEVSRQVYETLISLSKDYGTEMVLEGGVIRIMLDQISESS
jgi:poly-gamma-glutamate synthesis protein (capsule biosynthesis protein)